MTGTSQLCGFRIEEILAKKGVVMRGRVSMKLCNMSMKPVEKTALSLPLHSSLLKLLTYSLGHYTMCYVFSDHVTQLQDKDTYVRRGGFVNFDIYAA